MATEIQKLKKEAKGTNENPNETLVLSDLITESSAPENHLEEASDASIQDPQQPSALENSGTNGSTKEDGESKGGDCSGSPAADSAPASDIQKKMRRAERFGMPVQLSEEEKRNSRAERFGSVSTSNGTDALKNTEEQKRKARAERFGFPAEPAADEEVKKKARLARFAPVSKTDAVEEDKRKARAARFSQPLSSSVSHINGDGNMKQQAAITGKAGGGA